jgi:hypothetical protein
VHKKRSARTIVPISQLFTTLFQHSIATIVQQLVVVRSRAEVEAKAQAIATTFKVEKFCDITRKFV